MMDGLKELMEQGEHMNGGDRVDGWTQLQESPFSSASQTTS